MLSTYVYLVDVEDDSHKEDGANVFDEPLADGVSVVHGLVVVEGVVGRDVPLPGDGHRHEDGSGDGDLVEGEQEVREQQSVQFSLHVEGVLKFGEGVQ